MASAHDHGPMAANEPVRVTKKQLERKIERIERDIRDDYGFRPNISDDITGLKRTSFSSLYDPITFERDDFGPPDACLLRLIPLSGRIHSPRLTVPTHRLAPSATPVGQICF